jgi:argininosuccinate lyase
MTLWQGRFGESKQSQELFAFTESLSFDRRLAPDDIACSRAHVLGLERAGLLSHDESGALLAALSRVEEELAEGNFVFKAGDEDVHTAIERRVTELAPEVGARLHTGRSRNDQVATDLRLFTKRALGQVAKAIIALQEVLLARAREAGDAYLPGYTHLQRAQPVLLAHHLLAHGWALARDVDRIAATRRRLDVSPLGAGALAGSSLPLDPDWVARELGFSARFDNSIDAVSDRDFVAEALFDLALAGTHLSRLGEEIVLWSTEEFGFLHLDDAYATGSSMMPQKKNPDIAELARGKTGRLIGHLTALLATLKGLPLAYNRDLQEDKEPLFDAVDQVERSLEALRGLMATVTFDTQAMARAADEPTLAATDLAEWLVQRGMPFRTAHELVGAVVRDSLQRRVPLVELVAAHPALGSEATALLEPGVPVSRRTSPGGAGPAAVAVQLERFASALRTDAERFGMSRPASPGGHAPRGTAGGRHGGAPAGPGAAGAGGVPGAAGAGGVPGAAGGAGTAEPGAGGPAGAQAGAAAPPLAVGADPADVSGAGRVAAVPGGDRAQRRAGHTNRPGPAPAE